MPADILDQLRTERTKYSEDGANTELVESLDLILDKASKSSQVLSVLNSIVASMNGNGRALNENIHDICKSFKIYDRIATRTTSKTRDLSREFLHLGDNGKDSIHSINSELRSSLSLLNLVRKSVEKYSEALEGLRDHKKHKDERKVHLETPKKEKSFFDSLTKFSTGGKVGGSRQSGDRYIARLNAGEEILKKEQAKQIRQQLIEKRLTEKKLKSLSKSQQEEKKQQHKHISKQIKEEILSNGSIQKFATGGEIKNGPRSGDKKLIRVNAGEWVLTRNQMSTLGSKLGLKSPNDVFRAAGGSPFRKKFKGGLRAFDKGGNTAEDIANSITIANESEIEGKIGKIYKTLNDYTLSEKEQNKEINLRQKEIEKILKNTGKQFDKAIDEIEKSRNKKQERITEINIEDRELKKSIDEVKAKLEELEKPSDEKIERTKNFEKAKAGTAEEQRIAKEALENKDYQQTKGSAEEIDKLRKLLEKNEKKRKELASEKTEKEASIEQDRNLIDEIKEKKSDYIESKREKINNAKEEKAEKDSSRKETLGRLGNFGETIEGLQRIGNLKFDSLKDAAKGIAEWANKKGGIIGKVAGGAKKVGNSFIGKAAGFVGKKIAGGTIAAAGKLGGMLAGAASKFAPVAGQIVMAYQAFEKVVKAIQAAYEYLSKVVKTDIQSSQSRKAFDSQLGKGEYAAFEQSFGMLRDEMAKVGPQIQSAVREGTNFDQIKDIAANIKSATGELDPTLFSQALEAIKGMSAGEVNALMGTGTSADVESMYAAIGEKGNADEIADLMEKGVFDGGNSAEEDKNADLNAEGITAGDKAVVTELRVITRFVEDFKQSISKLMEGPLKAAFAIIIEPLKMIWDLLQPLVTMLSGELSAIGQQFEIVGKVIKIILSPILGIAKAFNNFFQKMNELRSGVLQKVIDGLEGLASLVSSFFEGLMTMVLEPIVTGISWIIEGIESIIDLIPFAGNKDKEKRRNEASQMRLLGALQRDLKKINSGQYSRSESSKREMYKRNMGVADTSYAGESQMRSNMSGAMSNAFSGFAKDMAALGESAKNLSKMEGEARLEAVKEFVAQQQTILEKHSKAVEEIINAYKNSMKFLSDAKANLDAGKGGLISGGAGDYYAASSNLTMITASTQQSRVKELRDNYDKSLNDFRKSTNGIESNLSNAVSPEKKQEAKQFAIASEDLAKAKADALANPGDKAKMEKAQALEKQVNQMYDHLTNGMSEADKLIIDGIQNASSALVAGAAAITKAEAEAKSAVYNAIKQLSQWDELWKESYGGMATSAASRNIQASQNLAMQNLSVSQASRATDAGIKNAKLQRKLADEDNKNQRNAKLASINKAQNEARSKLKDATGSERVELEKKIKEYDAARVIINQQANAQAKENKLKEMEAVKAAAQAEYDVKEKIVDLARSEYDIQVDLLQTIGAPMETILDLEKQRIGLVEAQLDNAKEYYNRLKENGASEMELRQAALNVQKQESAVVKARLGTQRSALEKIFGNMIGAFSDVAGIIGPNSDYANASKFGMGYTKNPDGTVARGGAKTGGYRDRLFAQSAGGTDVFDETNANAEDSELSFQDNIAKELGSIEQILSDIKDLQQKIKEEKDKEKEEKTEQDYADAAVNMYGKNADKTAEERRNMTAEERAEGGGAYGQAQAVNNFASKYRGKTLEALTGHWYKNDKNYSSEELLNDVDKRKELISHIEKRKDEGVASKEELEQLKDLQLMGDTTLDNAAQNLNKNRTELKHAEASVRESRKPNSQSGNNESKNDEQQIKVVVSVDPQNGNIKAYVDKSMNSKWNKDGKKMMNDQMNNGASVS